MIYSLEVFALTFIAKLNTLTWTYGLTFFLKLGYLKATLFGLIEWPFLLLGIFTIMTYGSRYPPLGFSAFVLLYPPAIIEFIDGQSTILFTWIIIIKLVNTIWGVPKTLIIIVGSSELLLKVLPSATPPNPWPKFVADPINTSLLIEFVLGATIISTHVVSMTTLNNWITFISTCCF